MDDKNLTSMKLSPKEGAEFAKAMESPKPPEFPFGLAIHLNEEQIQKMGLTDLPAADSEMHLVAKVVVTEATDRTTDRQGEEKKKDRRIELQITDMALSTAEKKENSDKLRSNNQLAGVMFGEGA